VRSYIPSYELVAPRDLAAALQKMATEPGPWKPFAGGTDLMVLLEAGKLPHRKFLSLYNLRELRGIEITHDQYMIGALTTYTEIRRHETLAREFPLLARAAAETGSIATQNRGTLGGNVANASPAADSPPALLVYEAELELVSSATSRWLPYRAFWSGYKQIALRPDELIRRIRLPRPSNANHWRQYYRKVGTRRAQAISKVCFAAAARIDFQRMAEVRIALGSVAPTVFRAAETERILQGESPTPALLRAAQETLAAEIAPIDDIRSTARYRRRITQHLLAEFFAMLSA
jgi:CO/xanthine dehydrogenase FAD-binding subunit